MTSERRGGAGRLSAYLFFTFLLCSVLLLGGAHRVTVIVLTIGVAAYAMAAVLKRKVSFDGLSLALLLCGVWTGLSLLPVPLGLIQKLSPHAAELWSMALRPLARTGPAWAQLALDPGAAWLEALKWFAYVFVAWWAAQVTRRFGLRAILAAVFTVATILAVITLLHAVFRLETVFGIYKPHDRVSGLGLSVLVNPNNRAAYLNLGGLCGLGLIVSRRPVLSRPILALGIIFCFSSSVWSGSRGGVGMLIAALLVLAAWWGPGLLRARGVGSALQAGLVVLAILSLFGLALLGMSAELEADLRSDDLSKLGSLGPLVPAFRDYWLVGVGRGGFESVSAMYQPHGGNVIYRDVENFVGSWAVEWGVPFTVLLLLALVYVLRPSYLRLKWARPAQAAYVGVLAVLLQNFADLGLELLSLTSVTIAVLASLIASRHERGAATSAGDSVRAPASGSVRAPGSVRASAAASIVAPLALAALCVCLVGAIMTGPDAYQARDQLDTALAASDKSEPAQARLHAQLTKEILKRPADPYPFIIGAVYARAQDVAILPWAAAALERAPRSGRVHLLTALGLMQRGARRQALFHLVEAVRYDTTLTTHAADQAVRLSRDPQFFLRSVSHDLAGARLLTAVASRWERTNMNQDRLLLAEAAARYGADNEPIVKFLANELLVEDHLLAKNCTQPGELPCPASEKERGERRERIRSVAASLTALDPCSGTLMNARLLEREGKVSEALSKLGDCNICKSPASCVRTALGIAAAGGDQEARRQYEQRYLALVCGSYESCARAEAEMGAMAERRGEVLGAYSHYYRAATRADKPEHWLAAARIAARAGLAAEAERAYKEAARQGLSDARVKQAVDAARRASMQQLLSP